MKRSRIFIIVAVCILALLLLIITIRAHYPPASAAIVATPSLRVGLEHMQVPPQCREPGTISWINVDPFNSSSYGHDKGYFSVTSYRTDTAVVVYIIVVFPELSHLIPSPDTTTRFQIQLTHPSSVWFDCSGWGSGIWSFPIQCEIPRERFETWERLSASVPVNSTVLLKSSTGAMEELPAQLDGHAMADATARFREREKMSKVVPLSMCAFVNREGWLLVEWIEFHLMMGVRDLHIYFHYLSPFDERIVRQYVKRGLITADVLVMNSDMLKLHHGYFQTLAMSHCFAKYNGTAKWMAVVDIDEFLVPTVSRRNATLLEGLARHEAEYPNAGYFRAQKVGFGSRRALPFSPGVSTFRRFPINGYPSGEGGHKSISKMSRVSSYVIHFPGSFTGDAVTMNPDYFFMAHYHSRCSDRDLEKGFVPDAGQEDWITTPFIPALEKRLANVLGNDMFGEEITHKCDKAT